MSAPQDRLVSDAEAEEFQRIAVEALSSYPYTDETSQNLATIILHLVRDRDGRIEIAAAATSKPGSCHSP